MKSLLRIFRFAKPYRVKAFLAMVLLVGVVISDLIIPRLTQDVIDRGIANRDFEQIIGTAMLMLGAAVLSALFSIGNTLASVRVAESVAADVRSALVRKVQTFSFGNLDRIQTGQLLVRATSDVNMVKTMVNMSLRMFIRAPLWMLGSMVMLVLTNAKLGLIIVIILPLVGVLIWIFIAKVQPLFLSVQKKLDRMNQVMQENLAGVRVIKSFVLEKHEKGRFDRANTNYTDQNLKVMRFIAALAPTMTLFVGIGTVAVLWYGGQLTITGDFTVGEIVASINYVSFSLFPLMMLAVMTGPLTAAVASAGRIFKVLDSDAMVQNREGASAVTNGRGRVAFENVTFSYNGKTAEAVLN
ncbi:MAG: ABC transporter ATP-binding protein, partial [Anaerolineales bacterium]|nr:ABC transporter ATP-binding protein [Anaerolineales bacterium]